MSIDVTREAGVATVTINRPERKNAVTMAMRQAFQSVFQDLQDDDEVRAIILTGAGGDFAAGADVGEMGTGGVRGNMVKSRTLHRMVRSVAHTNKPVIAAVEGVCIGVAFALALACPRRSRATSAGSDLLARPSAPECPTPACAHRGGAPATLPRGKSAAASCDWAPCLPAPAGNRDGDSRTAGALLPTRAAFAAAGRHQGGSIDTGPLCGSRRPVHTPDARSARDAHRHGRRLPAWRRASPFF